jgi:hypothetical protein
MIEDILNAARSLSPPDRRRLRQLLAEDEYQERLSQSSASRGLQRDLEMRWLSRHEAEFAGQWLALDGDRLIAHAPDAQQVYKEAFAAGVEAPFVAFAEDPQKPQWGGW